jgi:hypothetical protein
MFQPRLRGANHRNATINRFAASSVIYGNLSDRNVMQQNKINGCQLAKTRHLEQLEKLYTQKMQVEEELQIGHFGSIDLNFVDDVMLQKEAHTVLEQVKERIAFLESMDPEQKWMEKIGPLKPENIASLPILNAANGITDKIYRIDADRHTCGRVFKFESVTYRNVCPAHGLVYDVLIAAEDSSELQMQKMPPTVPTTSQAIAESRKREPNTSKRKAPDETKQRSKTLRISEATQTAQKNEYREYLMQFAGDAPKIPHTLIAQLHEELATIHLYTADRSKPIAVCEILKNGHLAAFKSHAVRINKKYSGEPVPVLTPSLIAACEMRYAEIQALELADVSIALKKPPFEIYTHYFLLSENRMDLASAFATFKTNNVSQGLAHKCKQLLDTCAKKSMLNWVLE